MASRERAPYEFSPGTRKTVLKEQNRTCAITGTKQHRLEVHHILGIGLATGFWPNIDPAIIKQRENAVALRPDVHKQLHEEMLAWPEDFLRVYVIEMYRYLRDLHLEKQMQPQQTDFFQEVDQREPVGV